MECESARLLLDGGQPLQLGMGSGIAGWVFSNGQPVFAESATGAPSTLLFGKLPDMPDFQAVVCMPVVINKSTRCVLCLAHTAARPMDEALRSFVFDTRVIRKTIAPLEIDCPEVSDWIRADLNEEIQLLLGGNIA